MSLNSAIDAIPVIVAHGGTGAITLTGVLTGNGTSAVTGNAVTQNGAVYAGASNAIASTGALTNGQILVGSTGVAPVAATLSAGSGVSVTNGAGTITIATTGVASAWTDVSGTTQAMADNNAYAANNGSLVTLTLPASSTAGAVIEVYYKGSGGWLIAQNANQQIRFGTSTTTVGAGGSLASAAAGDSVRIRCITGGASALWEVLGVQGNLTVV